jgi:hypothetical protein
LFTPLRNGRIDAPRLSKAQDRAAGDKAQSSSNEAEC